MKRRIKNRNNLYKDGIRILSDAIEMEPKLSPLQMQFNSIKEKYPDAVLLFRVGDYYETFGTDAEIVSVVTGITLVSVDKQEPFNKMAGFPHHDLDPYLHKLVKSGRRVAICEQLEDPKQVTGTVKRDIN
jgi:DNA mismatch repair protein MutS